MIENVRDLLDRALKLPPSSRAELARELIGSLDAALVDEDSAAVDEAWGAEIGRRLRVVKTGKAKLVSSKKAHADARRATGQVGR